MTSLSSEDDSPLSGLNVVSGTRLLLLENEYTLQRRSFKTGIKSIDAQFPNLFSIGAVIGLGATEARDRTLSIHIIATALASSVAAGSEKGLKPDSLNGSLDIFFLASPTSTIISELHDLLQRRLPVPSSSTAEEASLQLLDNVKLLQYLDLAGLVEGLSEISQTLHNLQEERPRPSILLMEGLSSALSTAQRRSGNMQIAALVANLVRTLIQLSRSSQSLLVLVELDVEISPGDSEGGILGSAFSSGKGEKLRAVPRGIVGEVLEEGMDVVALIHAGFGKTKTAKGKDTKTRTIIVETVKDRVGSRSGEWSTWVQESVNP